MKLQRMQKLATSHNFVAVVQGNRLIVFDRVYCPFSGETEHVPCIFLENEYNKFKEWLGY